MKTFIIAEAGVNHNGSLELAQKLIDAAAAAGADAVKFQTFRAEKLACQNAPKAAYQQQTTGLAESQFAMLKKLELDRPAHEVLIGHCRERGIMFLSSAFDLEGIDLLNNLGLRLFKIPSGEITNLPYLRKIGRLGKPVLLSTGMADLEEVAAAVEVLKASGTQLNDITILHCNTEYPTPMQDVNLQAMQTMAAKLGTRVGYSDHTRGIEVAVAAVALGAVVIEKHLTLDRTLPGPDHRASLEPHELQAMVAAVRNIEAALGDGLKRPSPSEQRNKTVARKSIVAAVPIKRGELLSDKNLTVKRPATGLSPMQWDEAIGRPAVKDFEMDEAIVLT